MLTEPGRLESGESGEGGEAGVDPVSGEADPGKRLALERVLPHPRVVQPGAHAVEVAHGELGQARVVRGAGPALEDGARVDGVGGGEEERIVPRHVEETRRQRQRLTADPAGRPLAVPAREDVLERRLDSRAEREPAREPLRHLAHRGERLPRPRRVRERRLDHPLAHLGGPPGPQMGAIEREHLLRVGRVDQEEGGPVHDVLAEQLRRLVAVRRAAGGMKERDVVGVGELLRRRARELAEADREHGRAQRVLEWLPGAEVGGERQGPDQLGRADRLLPAPTGILGRELRRFHVGILGRSRLYIPIA